MRKDTKGRIHFKVVFVGPSLSGKTTLLRYLHDQVQGLLKGSLTSVEDPSGRTIYFDFVPFSATGKVLLDVYTVAGQRRHRDQRKLILKGVDGLLFVADSNPELRNDNIESADELRLFFGEKLGSEIPLVIVLNKRDLPNAMARDDMIKDLSFPPGTPVFETIATKGVGVKRAFQSLSREIILRKLYAPSAETKPTTTE